VQINNTSVSYPINYTSPPKNTKTSPNETSPTSNEASPEPKTLKNMSLEQIQSYLENNNIEDDSNSRSKALFDIQKFSSKVDNLTYDKMTNALIEEESSSRASMRYATFPSVQTLDENPKIFHALLETSFEIEDTVRSLIFSLDLKKDYTQYKGNNEDLKDEIGFSQFSLVDFLVKKLLGAEEELRNENSTSKENRIQDYTSLLNNMNKSSKQEDNTKIDIHV